MSKLLEVRTYNNRRLNPEDNEIWGSTSVMEALKDIPFRIKRIFYIYGTSTKILRGGHRLKKSTQGLICLRGKYRIFVDNYKQQTTYVLNSPKEILILDKRDWHTMKCLRKNSILLVISSTYYDVEDYIDEPYPTTPKRIVKKVFALKNGK